MFAAFIVPTTFALSLGWRCWSTAPASCRPFFRSVFFLPTACSYVVAALVWKMSIFSGVRFGLANTVLGWFGIELVAVAVGVADPPWYWLVIVTRPAVAAGRLLHDPVPRRHAADLARRSTRRPRSTAREGWKVFRHITLPQLRATSTAVLLLLLINAFQAFDEFYNLLSTLRHQYPPYARPPLVYLYYTALGQGQDFGHGSAGAVILTLSSRSSPLGQGRVLRLGQRED